MKVPIPSNQSSRSWAVSLSFCGCWLLAVGLYASVALSPKFANYIRLRNDFHVTQFELVELEREVNYLSRVAGALERPDFSEELARVDFDASRPGDERVRVKPKGSPISRETIDASAPEDLVGRPAMAFPWYMPLVDMLASDAKLRETLLIAAGVILLVAFTFLHDGEQKVTAVRPKKPRSTSKLSSIGAAVFERYQSQ